MPETGHSELLKPDDLARIDHLEWISTRVVNGLYSGRHRSRMKGGCAEFAEHRAYSPGDEVRLLDWRVFAKSDRYYIRQYEEQTNLQALLVLDASGSMGFGMSTPSKFQYARAAGACLARLILRQSDAAGLAVVGPAAPAFLPPRAQPDYMRILLARLQESEPAGETSLALHLPEIAGRMKRRGMIVLFSDCFEDLERLSTALHLLRARGHEVLLFHTLAPEELAFAFDGWSRFRSLENPDLEIDLDPAVIREEYLGRLRTFLERLREVCGEARADYIPFPTDQPLGEALGYVLYRRGASVEA
jgi:uncharacterized protein (DUF58 family)